MISVSDRELFGDEVIEPRVDVVPVSNFGTVDCELTESTSTIVVPWISSRTSYTNIFCLPVFLNVIPFGNFFSPLSLGVNEIVFQGAGIVSQILSVLNITEPEYVVTVALFISIARTDISIASPM
jgi:hypothetical protein